MIVIAHNIRSLHNVGAILRSADAFGIQKVFLTGITGKPPRKEIAKVALGSEHRVNWEWSEDVLEVIRKLKQSGLTVIALDNVDCAISIREINTNKPIVLVLGNEVNGLDREVLESCDSIVAIEMPGAKQSLNVSVAAGIAMFALNEKSK